MPDIHLTQTHQRPATEEDEPFLRALFEERMPPGLRDLPLPPPQKAGLIEMQFRAQQAGYARDFPGSEHLIVERDGAPIGRIWKVRREAELHIIDIALLRSARGTGLGSALMRALLVEAAAAGLAATCRVAANNPGARRLWLRMGFRPVEDPGREPSPYELLRVDAPSKS